MALSSQKMNLDYIRTFVVLGQSSNMTDASKKLDVNVSYVSRHLKQLEESLNTRLIIPSPKNKDLQLTEAGQFFFDKYEKIYNDILIAEKEYKQTKQLDDCKITIGVSADLEDNLVKPKLLKYAEQFPNVCVKIVNGDTESLTKKLTQYALDIIIDKNMPDNNSKVQVIDTNKLYTSNYCFVYNKEQFNDIPNISEVPLILPINRTQERIIIDDYFSNNNIIPNIRYEVENTDRMLSYIKDGFGVGFMLKETIKDNDNFGIIDTDIKSDICVSYIKEKLTPSTKEFLKLFDIKL